MESSTHANASDASSPSDPLIEQMRSLLNLRSSAADTSRRRERRHSDTDRPSMGAIGTQAPLASTAVLSADGRWLPAPDERSHRYSGSSTGRPSFSSRDAPVPQTIEKYVCSCSSSHKCSMHTVFATTELLETILSHLDTLSIIEACTTDRRWYSIIQKSPQLRLHFFTLAQWQRPSEQYRLLPLSQPGVDIKKGDEIELGQWISVSLSPAAARRISPSPRPHQRGRSRSIFEGLRGGLGSQAQRAGGTWPESRSTPTISNALETEDLFITQPPLLGMQAYLVLPRTVDEGAASDHQDDEEPHLPAACAKISCEAGCTLGFLAETAQEILPSDSSAPSNIEDARVVFKAIVSFTPMKKTTKKRSTTRSVVRIS